MQPTLRLGPVVSYTTFSPLPPAAALDEARPALRPASTGGILSVALSVFSA
jgi:hypothetical protein